MLLVLVAVEVLINQIVIPSSLYPHVCVCVLLTLQVPRDSAGLNPDCGELTNCLDS